MKKCIGTVFGFFVACTVILTMLVGAGVTVAGISQEALVTQRKDRVLIVPLATESKTWDPMVGYGSGSDMVTYNIYEGLMSIEHLDNGTWTFKPLLATSWTEADNHTMWTFNLRQNVTFHDGTRFNSSAVKYWFDRMLGVNKGPAWLYDTYIDKVVPVDDYTVKMYLKQAMPSFDFKCIISNAFGAYGIVSPTYVKAHAAADDPWAKKWMYDHASGTGPYMLANVTHGVESVWLKNPNYWGGWQGDHIDKVVFPIVADQQVSMMKFLKKEVDMYGPTIEQIPGVLSQMPEARLDIDKEYLSVTYIFMNMEKKGPLQDINVRKAVSYAFDYQGVIDHIYAGYAGQARGPLPHGIPYWDPNLMLYQTNLTKAKAYLANSSYPNGFTATIVAGPGDWERVAEVFQRNMALLGITINIQSVQYAVLWDMMANGTTAPEFSIALWYPDYPTADVYLTPVFGPMETAWQNWAFYVNPQVNTLLDQGRFEFNETKQAQTYRTIQKLIVDDAPTVFMYEQYRVSFLQNYVKGFKRSPLHGGYSIYSMSIEGKYPGETITPPPPPPSEPFPTTYLVVGVAVAIVVLLIVVLIRKR